MKKTFRIFKRHPSHIPQFRRYTRSKAGNFFYFFFLILFGLFSVLPLYYSVVTSFKPLDELLVFPPKFYVLRPTFSNYLEIPPLLSNLNVPLSRYIFNSVFICAATTFLHIIISAMAAFVLSKGTIKGKNIIFWMIQFALMFNAYTLAIPQFIISNGLGIIDTYWAYILPSLASTMGVFLMKQYMEGYIPYALIESARIDGAGYLRLFWSIIMPIVKPAWLTLTLFAFNSIWSMTSSMVFSEELKTLPAVMSQIMTAGIARQGSGMAVSVILMIPPIIVYMVSQSNVMQTMSSAGIKG